MHKSEEGSDAAVNSLFEVKFQIDSHHDLPDHEEEERVGGDRMDVFRVELPAAVQVAEGVTEERQQRAKDL
jgi:hypothetical protein